MSDLVFVDDMPEVAEMHKRIAALEAEVARLTAEREAARFQRDYAIRCEAEAQEFVPCNICAGTGTVEIYPPRMDGTDAADCPVCSGSGVKPHRALLEARAQFAAARQSRARLVRLVRTLRAQLTTAWGIEAQAEHERDAARDAAAAWKRAARKWWAEACVHKRWGEGESIGGACHMFERAISGTAQERRYQCRAAAEAMERR